MNQLPPDLAAAILSSLARGRGMRATAREHGVSVETVRRYARAVGHQPDKHAAMRAQALPGCTNEERSAAARVRKRQADIARNERRQRHESLAMPRDADAAAVAAIQRLDRALAAAESRVKALEKERARVGRAAAAASKQRRREARVVAVVDPADERARELAALLAEQEKDDRTLQIKYEPELPYAVTGAPRPKD